MSILSRILPAALLAGGIAGGQADAQTYDGYEIPPYTVEQTLGAVEIRRYAPHIVAEVTVEGDRRAALNQGFRILAGYIFGGNDGGARVAMTAPVAQTGAQIDMTAPVAQSGHGDLWTVSFTMPSQWTLDTLPQPNSPAVRFRATDPERVAVIIFSGRASGQMLQLQEERLRSAIEKAGLSATGPVRHAFYDDPMTLPWARRNEVALALR